MKSKKSTFQRDRRSNSDEVKTRLLNHFENHPGLSIKFNSMIAKIKLQKNDKALLRDILRSLVDEGKVIKRGKFYEIGHKKRFFEGRVVPDRNGDYSIESKTDLGFERFMIRKRNLQTALIDDIVEFSIIEFADRDHKEAIVERIVNRAVHRITGKLEFSSRNKEYAFVVPDDNKFRKDIFIPHENLKSAVNGDKVICQITNWEYQDLSPEGKIIEVLGKAGEVETEFKAILRKYGLTKSFPKKVKNEVSTNLEDVKFQITEDEITKRVDLREKTIFTIDPVNAKDFDDAVHIEMNKKGNYLLGVHIADVSFYVRENSHLDIEAFQRGTSVYLMNDVVPMLPEKLSNDICSLKQGEERLTFSVSIEITSEGEIVHFSLFKSVIKSKRRFTYNEVQRIIDTQNGEFVDEINMMNKLHKILFRKRLSEGSLDFETQEVDVEIDVEGSIKNIKPLERLESMRIIEDFILLANKCVTIFIERKDPKPPFIYRIHDIPDKKKMKELSFFVKQFGINLNPESKRSIQNMLDKIRGSEEEYLINDLTIRSMSKAIYSEDNIGHYGLGFKSYTHFTSPIRRYPDLVVHRMLFENLSKMNNRRIQHFREVLPEVCQHSTETELNGVQAEREAVRILQIQFLQKHTDETFKGVISGITEFGLYVEISKYLIEGMVRLRDLKDDYYILDERNHRLIGRSRKKTYRVGDKVRVRVLRLDKEKKWIDFEIIV